MSTYVAIPVAFGVALVDPLEEPIMMETPFIIHQLYMGYMLCIMSLNNLLKFKDLSFIMRSNERETKQTTFVNYSITFSIHVVRENQGQTHIATQI